MSGARNSSPSALQTFEIRPTPIALAAGERPDELMIDWGNLPAGSSASLYLPGVSADEMLALAATMYPFPRFSRVDAHTLTCQARGISYLPIPTGEDGNFAGLLTLSVPPAVNRGEPYKIVVRQVTNSPVGRKIGASEANTSTVKVSPSGRWQLTLGSFQTSLPVKNRDEVLLPAERLLAVLLWIQEAIHPTSRWHPVFVRYLAQLSNRISGLGGDPTQIGPSPSGAVPRLEGSGPGTCDSRKSGDVEVTGKVDGIMYDRFGDFEGFILETSAGDHKRFLSGEQRVHRLIRRAWLRRIVVTIVSDSATPHRPATIILRAVPPFTA